MSILIKHNINNRTWVECEVYHLPLDGVCLLAAGRGLLGLLTAGREKKEREKHMSILIKLNINKTTRVECEVYCLPLYGVCLMADFF